MDKILPGQLWLARNKMGYEGDMVYLTCSQDDDDPWVCMCFQEWEFGAFRRDFYKDELLEMQYIGCLKDLKGHHG